MKGNNIKLGFDSDRCVGTWRARTVNRIIALVLVFALLPVWGVPYAFALGRSDITLRDELTVTADVVGGEEILPIPEAVLHAAIGQDVPEGYVVAYQWQRATSLGVSSMPEPTAEPKPTPEPEPPAEPEPGVSSVPETEQPSDSEPAPKPAPTAEPAPKPEPTAAPEPEPATESAVIATPMSVSTASHRLSPMVTAVRTNMSTFATEPEPEPTTAPGVSSVPETDVPSEPEQGEQQRPEHTPAPEEPEMPAPEEPTIEPQWEDIPGAVGDTYTLTEEDVGQYVRVNVIVARSMRRMRAVQSDADPYAGAFAASNAVLVRAATNTIYVGAGGNDNNDGLTPATRVLTFERAEAKVSRGGIISVVESVRLQNGWPPLLKKGFKMQSADSNKMATFYFTPRLEFATGSGTYEFENMIFEGSTAMGSLNPAFHIAGSGVNLKFTDTTIQNFARNLQPVVKIPSGSTVTLNKGSEILNSRNGNNVEVDGGAFVMEGGSTISGCYSGSQGGAVYVAGGSFNMKGGTITNNTSSSTSSGAVYVSSNGNFSMSGGEIKGNKSLGTVGGGVYLKDSTAKLNIDGSSVITGNTANGKESNIYLAPDATITLGNNFAETSKIGVTPAVKAIGTTIVSSGATPANKDCFSFDENSSPIYGFEESGGQLKLVHTLFVDGSVASGGDGTKEKPFNSLSDATAAVIDGTVINLSGEIQVGSQSVINNSIILQSADKDNPCILKRAAYYKGSLLGVIGGDVTLRNVILDGGKKEGTDANGPLLHVNGGGAQVVAENSTLQNNSYGGARVDLGTLTLKAGCVVTGNSLPANGGVMSMGDGIHVSPGGTLNLEENATVELGGGQQTKPGDIYAGGTLNISGKPKVADIHLPVGKSLRIAGSLTGIEGDIGLTIDTPEASVSRIRIFASNVPSDLNVNIFKWNNKPTDVGKNAQIQRIGTNLAVTNYSQDARLDSLSRNSFISAGEVGSIVPKDGKTLKNFDFDAADNTSEEELVFTLPYSLSENTTVNLTAEVMDKFSTINVTGLPSAPVYVQGRPLVIPVGCEPAKFTAGGEIKAFTINVTSQFGTPTKSYKVIIKRGLPKLTGNNTVNVNFITGSPETKTHYIIMDKMSGSIGIDESNFKIREVRLSGIEAPGAVVDGVVPHSFDKQTGKLEVSVTSKYAISNTHESSLFVRAGKKSFELWVNENPLGIITVNMTISDEKMMEAFQKISHLDWGAEVYPKNAYVRVEDQPEGEKAWPPAEAGDLFAEDREGSWGKLENGVFVPFEETGSVEDEHLGQGGYAKVKLEKYAKNMVEKKLQEIADDYGIKLPKHTLEAGISKYQPAHNANSTVPNGEQGLYTFRIDINLPNVNSANPGITVMGAEHSIKIVPKVFNGISAEALQEALQNGNNGVFDTTLSGSVWAHPTWETYGIEMRAAVQHEFVTKPGSAVGRRLEWMMDQPVYKDYIVMVSSEGDFEVWGDGLHYYLATYIDAYKRGCPEYIDEDGVKRPEEKYITMGYVEIPLDVDVQYHKTDPRIMAERAAADIRDALNSGALSLDDVTSYSAAAHSEANMLAYVGDKVLAAVNTPAGTRLESGLGDGASITLEKPLRDMVKVNIAKRYADEVPYIPAVDGSYQNKDGVQGQYTFAVSVSLVDGSGVSPVPLDFGGVPVKSISQGGTVKDDGIAILPRLYNDSSDDSGSSGGSTSKPSPTPTPAPVTVPTVKVPGDTTAASPTSAPKPTPKPTGKPSATPGVPLIPGSENVAIAVMANQADGLSIRFADDQAVIRAVLTPEELKLIESGQKIEISLKVNKVLPESPDAVSADDRAIIKAEADKNKLTLGVYLDVKVDKRIGSGEWTAVTNLGEAIRVSMDIPPELHKAGRIFSIARVHNGEVGILPNLSSDHETIIFETDRFSTYAIVYSDAEFAQDVQTVTSWLSSLLLGVGVGAAVLVVGGLALWLIKRKKRAAAK